jgi:hypothetical protein
MCSKSREHPESEKKCLSYFPGRTLTLTTKQDRYPRRQLHPGRNRLTPQLSPPPGSKVPESNSDQAMQGQQGLDLLSGASEYLRNNPIKSADMNLQEQDLNRPRKRRRAALACEQCRQRKLK